MNTFTRQVEMIEDTDVSFICTVYKWKGDITMFDNKKIYDAHVHAHPYTDDLDACIQSALDYLSFTGLSGLNILLMRGGWNALGSDSVYLYLKALYPDKFSVYNGLAIGYDSIPYDAEGLATQVKDMMDAGFDGLKMINNRSTKDTWGFEFDDERMDPMFALLEQTQFPITWHVGNTEHWPEQRGPKSEILRKTPFNPGNEPDNEPAYARLEHVLAKHSKLHLVIPHWLFMCENRERLEAFMENHPNVAIDACPGSGMLYYMGQSPEEWHNFIVKYQDRLIFGTDNSLDRIDGALELQLHLRRFLETNETFFTPFDGRHAWGFDVTGIGPFPDEIIQKICKDNFNKIRGGVHPVNISNAIVYLEKELGQLEKLSAKDCPENGRAFVRQVIARMKAMQ